MAEKSISAKTKRQRAMAESSLPYSFTYKIRRAFIGKNCPVCGCEMGIDREFGLTLRMPSVQHNIPVSKGGKHELGNISVICKTCNITIQDKETSELNAVEVAKTWLMLNG